MEADAEHDFVPSDPASELPFNKGDKLLILNYGVPVQWYNAVVDGRKGLVPCNYITIKSPSWYHGRISRLDAEKLLQNKWDGAFLVRLSESSPTEFSLSVRCGNQVQHFRILKDENHQYFLWTARFPSLNKMVEHYKTESVSRTSQIFLRDSDEEFLAEALFDFNPEENSDGETELRFSKGEIITVSDSSDDNWWGGRIGDRSGYFPRTYVKRCKSQCSRTTSDALLREC